MMSDEQKVYMEIRKLTCILMVVATILMQVLKGQFSVYGVGVLIGAFTGLMGFQMIIRYVHSLDNDTTRVKLYSYRSYIRRYVLYFVILGISVWKGVNIFALLVGMLCSKGAVLWYTYRHRKEAV